MRFILCFALAAQAAVLRFPPGADVASVRDFGAVGDGRRDDTEAIQRAVHHLIGSYRYLYFPAGTYRITRSIEWKFTDRDTTLPCKRDCWSNGLTFLGEDRDRTVIRLQDSLPAFGDKARPAGVIITASGPNGVESRGDNAFGNSILNLTVDVGRKNPGAVGIDYLATNTGAIRDVTVRAPADAYCGIMMTRPFIGPCLIKGVAVTGFDYAIMSDHNRTQYTLEDVSIAGQAVAGIRVAGGTVAIRNLTSRNAVTALENRKPSGWTHAPTGLVALVESRLLGGKSGAAVLDQGHMFIRRLTVAGYPRAYLGESAKLAAGSIREFSSKAAVSLWSPGSGSISLPVEDPPRFWEGDTAKWAILPPPSSAAANRAAFKAAMAGGKTVILFRPGTYEIDSTLAVTGSAVRHILGNGTTLHPGPAFSDSGTTMALMEFRHRSPSLTVENLNFGSHTESHPGLVCLSHRAPARLVLRDLLLWDQDMAATYSAAAGAGHVNIENVSGQKSSTWHFRPGQQIWARQFNVEGTRTKVVNDGARLWILGMKTESAGTIVKGRNGAWTEILGGLFVNWRDYTGPAFSIDDAHVSASFSTSVDRPACHFRIYAEETRRGKRRELPFERVSSNAAFTSTSVPLFLAYRPDSIPAYGAPGP